MEAIGHAGTCLGILTKDGVILAAERKNINNLLDEEGGDAEKTYKIHEDAACSVAGITSDANVLTRELRVMAQRYLLNYDEPIPLEQLVRQMSDIKQMYTQHGGNRPFGVSILYMGWDKHFGYQLYQSDPSGNYQGWKAMCIGNNHSSAVSMLKQEYVVDCSLDEGLLLATKIMSKTMDATKLTVDKVEMTTLTREDGKTKITSLEPKRVQKLIDQNEEVEAKKGKQQ